MTKKFKYVVYYSDGSCVTSAYQLDEATAYVKMSKEISEHFIYGNKNVTVIEARVFMV